MGSIPVAGAKRGELQRNSPLLAPAREPITALARNWVRIPRPQIDKLACQAKDVGIFAIGEILAGSAKHTLAVCFFFIIFL